MQNSDWIALIRMIPVDEHCKINLQFQNRTEISVETVFRLDPNYMVVRGRFGGTTDGGLLFIVPYEQLTCVMLNREVKEADVRGYFGEVAPGASPVPVENEEPAAVAAEPAPAPTAAGSVRTEVITAPAGRPAAPPPVRPDSPTASPPPAPRKRPSGAITPPPARITADMTPAAIKAMLLERMKSSKNLNTGPTSTGGPPSQG
jgi:hypothetical protein